MRSTDTEGIGDFSIQAERLDSPALLQLRGLARAGQTSELVDRIAAWSHAAAARGSITEASLILELFIQQVAGLGGIEVAERWCERVFRFHRDLNIDASSRAAEVHIGFAICAVLRDDLDAAEDRLRAAIRVAESLPVGCQRHCCYAYASLGMVHLHLRRRNFVSALRVLLSITPAVKKSRDDRLRSRQCVALTHAYVGLHEFEKASRCIRRALAILEIVTEDGMTAGRELATSLLANASVQARRGDHQGAIQSALRADALVAGQEPPNRIWAVQIKEEVARIRAWYQRMSTRPPDVKIPDVP